MNLLHKYLSLPYPDKWLFIKALCISLVVKIVVVCLPLRWYSKYLREYRTKDSLSLQNKDELITRITNAVRRSSKYAPWPTRCLVDGITAKLLLQQHGIHSTLFLGVHKDKEKKMIAHAWLKCGDKFITGRRGYQKFTVVSSFT
ncbi:MAG TPA: lasso peptide biosynthesis B2 protein [Bacteroidales bacterium]|nr:lasso peptide biosynthesis B2 protein [Bacteroidales bacterium]